MGDVKIVLSQGELKDREKHNSRLFVDLGESIHLHYREYRFVFSLPEFFEYVNIVGDSARDVRNYLRNNADYEEQKYGATIMVAGGKERLMKFLENSPVPNKSYYMNNLCRIELNEEFVTDEIHIHYRDFRIALNRENFKDIVNIFVNALKELEKFENENVYQSRKHPDRAINDWDQPKQIKKSATPIMGTVKIPIEKINSKWHANILKDYEPNFEFIEAIKENISRKNIITPIILSKSKNDTYILVNGHHRLRAFIELGYENVDAVIVDLSWDETKGIRDAESILKTFDISTDYRYGVSKFLSEFLADKMNTYYRDSYLRIITPSGRIFRFFRAIKRLLFRLPLPGLIKIHLEKWSKQIAK